jgi:hypothetical protein
MSTSDFAKGWENEGLLVEAWSPKQFIDYQPPPGFELVGDRHIIKGGQFLLLEALPVSVNPGLRCLWQSPGRTKVLGWVEKFTFHSEP